MKMPLPILANVLFSIVATLAMAGPAQARNPVPAPSPHPICFGTHLSDFQPGDLPINLLTARAIPIPTGTVSSDLGNGIVIQLDKTYATTYDRVIPAKKPLFGVLTLQSWDSPGDPLEALITAKDAHGNSYSIHFELPLAATGRDLSDLLVQAGIGSSVGLSQLCRSPQEALLEYKAVARDARMATLSADFRGSSESEDAQPKSASPVGAPDSTMPQQSKQAAKLAI